MANSHLLHAWDHTAAILTKIHNVNIAKQADAITDVAKLNPIRVARSRQNQKDPTPDEVANLLTSAFLSG